MWAVLNAYRNEVYAQPFAVPHDGNPRPLAEPAVAAPADLFAELGEGPLVVVGSGADAYAELLGRAAESAGARVERSRVASGASSGWLHAPAPAFLAGGLALLAGERAADGHEPGPVEPCYVRPSEAEINLKLGRLAGVRAG